MRRNKNIDWLYLAVCIAAGAWAVYEYMRMFAEALK